MYKYYIKSKYGILKKQQFFLTDETKNTLLTTSTTKHSIYNSAYKLEILESDPTFKPVLSIIKDKKLFLLNVNEKEFGTFSFKSLAITLYTHNFAVNQVINNTPKATVLTTIDDQIINIKRKFNFNFEVEITSENQIKLIDLATILGIITTKQSFIRTSGGF